MELEAPKQPEVLVFGKRKNYNTQHIRQVSSDLGYSQIEHSEW